VFERLWEETGRRAVVSELAGKRNHGFALERAVFLASATAGRSFFERIHGLGILLVGLGPGAPLQPVVRSQCHNDIIRFAICFIFDAGCS
jgi:hypothetical protein